jgi:phosphonate transport system ATP-binding protein
VVGHCTSTTARILCCVNEEGGGGRRIARLAWRAGAASGVVEASLTAAPPYQLGVLDLRDLPAGAEVTYAIDVSGDAAPMRAERILEARAGSFRLLPAHRPPRVALLSCNGAFEIDEESRRYDMWKRLRGEIDAGNIDLVIHAGERVAMMGRSGAGKTTLLNLLYQRTAERVALIPQAAALVKPLSVFHNVYMGRLDRCSTWHNLRTLAWPARRDIDEIARVLGLVDLSDKLFVKAGELSGGQQQRASVARALYNGRPILIGDEPVSALDRVQGAAVLARLCERHETAVFALHDIPLALSQMDRVIVLDEGRIVLDAPARDLHPADLVPWYGG